MKPGLVMVIDPQPNEASAVAAGMLVSLQANDHPQVTAAEGTGFSAAAIAPPAKLPASGADVYTDNSDILIWTGDLFLPDNWPKPDAQSDPHRAVSYMLLQRLRSKGVAVFADLDGAFCGVWYDHTKNRWVIFNDRLGLLPIFWTQFGDRLVIGPSAWVTWQGSGWPLTIDEDGVVDVIRAMNVTEDHTLIEGVHWLRGGHVLFYQPTAGSASSCKEYKYWEFHHLPSTARNKDEATDEYIDALKQTLVRQTAGVSSLMLGISGGMDSRMILALCDALDIRPACYTCGWPFSEDVRFGRRLAKLVGAPHEYVPLRTDLLPDLLTQLIIECDGLHSARHLGTGSTTPAYLADYAGSVLLEGHIHGILGGGCVPAPDDIDPNRAPHESAWARKHAHGGGDVHVINNLLLPDLAQRSFQRFKDQIDDRFRRAPSDDPLQRAEYASVNGRSGRNDVLGPSLWRHDVLVRSPATDRVMLDWCARTPGLWRKGKQLYMEILRRRFPKFARVQRSDYNGLCISENRLLREYHWQREKLYRLWAAHRYPQTANYGLGGKWTTAWIFNTWRQAGDLSLITEPDARVLNWVAKPRLQAFWEQALRDPTKAVPLLSLGTIEAMVRYLESLKSSQPPSSCQITSQKNAAMGVLQCTC